MTRMIFLENCLALIILKSHGVAAIKLNHKGHKEHKEEQRVSGFFFVACVVQ
jgi:hypothetical protein